MSVVCSKGGAVYFDLSLLRVAASEADRREIDAEPFFGPIQCKTAVVNLISTEQCYSQGIMTKASVVRLCRYSYSNYCLKAATL